MHKHLIHLPPLVGWCVLISDFHSVSAVSLECYRAFVEQNRSRSSDREGSIQKTSYVNFVSSVVERFFLPLTTQCNSSCTLKFLSVPMIKGDLNFSWILLTRKVTSQIFEMDAVHHDQYSCNCMTFGELEYIHRQRWALKICRHSYGSSFG